MVAQSFAFLSPLAKQVNLLSSKLLLWEKELAEMPEGTLYISQIGGRHYFTRGIGKKRCGITRQPDLTYQLARKQYLKLLIASTKEQLSGIGTHSPDQMQVSGSNSGRRLEKFLSRCVQANLNILRITCSEKQYQWFTSDFPSNPVEMSGPIYKTHSGITVRSKSELFIGNALEKYGIPYHYEHGLRLNTEWIESANGPNPDAFKIVYPDFTIPTFRGNRIIWEHLGLVSKPAYRAHNMEKIALYRQGGLCDHDHLILTFERDLQDSQFLDALITARILPLL